MRKRQLILPAFLSIAGAGCARTESIADAAGRMPSLETLSSVHLGMRAYALRRARPRVVAAPYFGFRERVGSTEIWYEVPGSVQDGEGPPLWASLQSVVATEHIDDTTNVFAGWQRAVERGSLRMRADPACYTLSSPDRAAWLAIWSRPQAEVFVAAQKTRRDSTAGTTSGTLSTGVARPGHALSRAVFAPQTSRPCPELVAHRPGN